MVVGPIIGNLHAEKQPKTASNSLCPVHIEGISEFFSVSTIVDSADVEDDWECRCAVPKYGNNPTYELPVCSEEFTDILETFRDLFNSIPSIAKVEEFRIHTSNNIPVRTPPRMIPQAYRSEVDKQINDMLDRNIIRISSSPYLSLPVIVGKKDGGIRFCIDYRNLNKITQKDAYPLPLPDQVQDKLNGMRYFTKLDLNSGYWQIPVSEDDREKTAFSVGPGMGLFEFNVLPFGLTGGPSACQRIMDQVMHGLERNTDNFIDDILIFSPDAFSHRKILQDVFQRLRIKKLTLRGKKCEIGRRKINYLGHTFSSSGMSPDQSKIESIVQWPRPSNQKELKQFLGLAGYYRRYINNFASISNPLNDLLRKEVNFEWTKNTESAFLDLKNKLSSGPVLVCPNFTCPFTLCTDASSRGLGAVLEQNGHAVAYYSRSLKSAEKNYSVVEQECLAIVEALKRFRHYLLGRRFQILTDHKPLEWLANQKSIGRLWRWAVILQEYDFIVKYRQGKENNNADALSRILSIDGEPVESIQADNGNSETNFQINSWKHTAVTELTRIPDMSRVQAEQLRDQNISRIMKEIEIVPLPERFSGLEWDQPEFKRYKQIQHQLQLMNGVLVRSYKIEPFSDTSTVTVIPDTMKREILSQVHDEAGHQGMERTLSRLKLVGYWVNMASDVVNYVASCEVCQKAKLPLPTRAPLQYTPIGRTMQLFQVDVLEVPLSSKGNRYLVAEDAFSKWIECFPMKDQKAETITNLLVEVFARLGTPEFLHSDQGRNFESSLLKETCKTLGIKKTRTTAYHPQGNSLVERGNRTVLQMLRCYVDKSHEWEEFLPLVLYAYRTTKHSSTGITPFELMYGRDPPNVMHHEKPAEHNPSSYELFLRKKLAELRGFVEGNIIEAQKRQKKYYDSTSRLTVFTRGDPVWLSIPHGGVSRKLDSKWEGGWKIIEMKSPVSAKIQNRDGSTRVVHINRLQHRNLRSDGLLGRAIVHDQLDDSNYKLTSEPFERSERVIGRIPVRDSSMCTPEVSRGSIPRVTEGSYENTLEGREYEGSIQEVLDNSVDNSVNGLSRSRDAPLGV